GIHASSAWRARSASGSRPAPGRRRSSPRPRGPKPGRRARPCRTAATRRTIPQCGFTRAIGRSRPARGSRSEEVPVRFFILLGAFVVAAPRSHAQQPARIVQISRVSSPPHLDQFLDHRHTEGGPRHRSIETGEGGLGVVVTDLRQREPGDGTPVSEETTVYLSYDDENLYAVFVCRDEPAKIRASIARREEIDADDAV